MNLFNQACKIISLVGTIFLVNIYGMEHSETKESQPDQINYFEQLPPEVQLQIFDQIENPIHLRALPLISKTCYMPADGRFKKHLKKIAHEVQDFTIDPFLDKNDKGAYVAKTNTEKEHYKRTLEELISFLEASKKYETFVKIKIGGLTEHILTQILPRCDYVTHMFLEKGTYVWHLHKTATWGSPCSRHTSVGDDLIKILSQGLIHSNETFSNLEVLTLHDNKITDEGVQHLIKGIVKSQIFLNLKTITLWDNSISNEKTSEIKEMPSVRDIFKFNVASY